MTERVPAFVGWVTAMIGAALVARPRLATGPLGLDGRDGAVRAIGASDLLLVPGLLRARTRWPWMAARAILNVAIAHYLTRVAPESSSPSTVRAGAGVLAALTVMDGATAVTLRRTGR